MPDSKELTDISSQLKKTVISAEKFKRGSSFDTSKSIVNIHKTLSSLAGHTRKLTIRIGSVEKSIDNNSRKITILKNLSEKQSERISGNNIGSKLPGSSTSNIEDNISAITKSVSSIAEILSGRKRLADATSAYEKRKAEQEKRALAESKLEKRFEGLKKVAEKIISPVKSVLDRILEFFTTVILGRVVYKLIEWLGNPENAGKLKTIIRFVKDWWPALLGSYILFGTSFGKLTRGLLGMVGKFIYKIGKIAIPRLLKFIARNPKASAAVGLFTAGATIPTLLPGTVNEQEEKIKEKPGTTEDKIRLLEKQKASLNIIQKMQGVGSEIDEQIYSLKTGQTRSYPAFSGGGFVNGFVSGEKGVDKVPAMLSDGEFVMSRGAVQKYGVDTLEAMNAAGGGTNRPRVVSGTSYAAGGGLIGRSGSYDVDKFAGSAGYYVGEILRGLAPQYKWASKLARDAGVSIQNTMSSAASGVYDTFMNQGAKMHGYLTRGGMQNDIMNISNQSYNYLKSSDFQNQLKEKGVKLVNAGQSTLKNALGAVDSLQLGKKYQDMANRNQKSTDKQISSYDNWIKGLPEGFLKDTMNRGLIPVPTFGEKTMTAFTFAKAMAGPFGRPFRIMSNDVVDRARQEMIDRTAQGSGLRVGPDGKLSMDWNRVSGKGSGQYTDELDALGGDKGRGKFFNSTFGRLSAQQKGDKLVTGDVYNFNETVKQYAIRTRDSLMKGNVGEALYNVLAMSGRFAQDIGWLNQRALGSEVEIGSVEKIDKKTGKPLPPPASVTMYDKNDPRRKDSSSYKSRFARPKNSGLKPVSPPTSPKPKVVYGPPVPSSKPKYRGKGARSSTRTPSFNSSSSSKAKMSILGITI